MARQVLHDHAALLYWESMRSSTDETLAALAARAVNETRFHLRHSTGWLIRLGDGTDESHRRAQAGLDTMWPYAGELLGADDEDDLRTAGLIGPRFDGAWRAAVAATVAEATLTMPPEPPTRSGGLGGEHSEHLAPILEVMQGLARAHPGATW